MLCGIGLPLPSVAGDLNGIRIGTLELTRLGMDAATMEYIAGFIARILVKDGRPESVRNDVVAFRRDYQTRHYVR
jgi:glycine hydroxymethyltransferase